MKLFDPINHHFVELNHDNPWSLKFYELANHPKFDGIVDFCRLNLYLTKDKDCCAIWNGLLDPIFAESSLKKKGIQMPEDFDLSEYNEPLFRGYIESEEQAIHILKTLRHENVSVSELCAGKDGRLRCELMGS